MGESDKRIAPTQSLVLDLPPSCVEFCPAHPAYFVVGTYNLIKEEQPMTESEDTDPSAGKKTQHRSGSLIVFRQEAGAIRHVQTVSHPSAILDLHFCPLAGRLDVLGVVSSTGTLSIFRLDPDDDASEPLKELATSRISDIPEGVLFLSGVWRPSDPASIAITTSTGEVRLIGLDESWNIIEEDPEPVITHSLEAWTVAFSPPEDDESSGTLHNLFVVYSGGDDSALRYTSCVSGKTEDKDSDSARRPLKIDGHGAGVTAILPVTARMADGSRVLLTGSYDDTIRVLAVQPPHEVCGLRKFKQLAEVNLGGGVWRLKLVDIQLEDEHCRLRVLASCMHAGARVVELAGPLNGEDWHIRVLARFEEHKSMNYGSDFVPGSGKGCLVCVSTSFYDKLLCLWETELS